MLFMLGKVIKSIRFLGWNDFQSQPNNEFATGIIDPSIFPSDIWSLDDFLPNVLLTLSHGNSF